MTMHAASARFASIDSPEGGLTVPSTRIHRRITERPPTIDPGAPARQALTAPSQPDTTHSRISNTTHSRVSKADDRFPEGVLSAVDPVTLERD